MTSIQSHYFKEQPPLFLEEHLAQVKRVATFLLQQHHAFIYYPQTAAVAAAIVDCHDLGKGSAGFQSYIKNPTKFLNKREKEEKAHTALSAALAILWAKQQNWQAFDILALTQSVAGHHSGFRALREGDKTLDNYLRSNKLEKQWKTLNYRELSQATGLSLENIMAEFEEAHEWLFNDLEIEEKMTELSLPDAVIFRLWTQFLFSILLEADKALLALRHSESHHYFEKSPHPLSPTLVSDYLAQLSSTHFDPLRQAVRQQLIQTIYKYRQERCFTLTVPTGVGKTLLAATWALEQRQMMAESGIVPKMIIVLPFLSIVDQTETIYRELLKAPTQQSDLLMSSHSLAQREWDSESEQNSSAFFLDIWRSDVVITTFDQFLLALFSPKTKYLMRFHHLMDALIILDEVQTLPVKLWDLVNQTLQNLVQLGHSKVLLMSATQPGLLQPAVELVGEHQQIQQLFDQCNRYRLVFKHRVSQSLDEFIKNLIPRMTEWIQHQQRPLITLNTRASAKKVWQALNKHFGENVPVYLISADLIPRDRLQKIATVKTKQPCIVVSTQTIEAGVDIDMDVVIRDFAPLEALIQIAGRCNRHLKKGDLGGLVEIVSLMSQNGREYVDYVYDKTILNATRDVLNGCDKMMENEIFPLVKRYFDLLKVRKNTGSSLTKQFAYWQELEDIHQILRPQFGDQIAFLVIDDEECQQLMTQLQQAFEITDRWEKRRVLQTFAAELNKRTVTAYERKNFYPEQYIDSRYAELFKNGYAVLKAQYYDTQQGLQLNLPEDDRAVCII